MARLIPTPPTGDIAWAASPNAEQPVVSQRRRRSSRTSSRCSRLTTDGVHPVAESGRSAATRRRSPRPRLGAEPGVGALRHEVGASGSSRCGDQHQQCLAAGETDTIPRSRRARRRTGAARTTMSNGTRIVSRGAALPRRAGRKGVRRNRDSARISCPAPSPVGTGPPVRGARRTSEVRPVAMPQGDATAPPRRRRPGRSRRSHCGIMATCGGARQPPQVEVAAWSRA